MVSSSLNVHTETQEGEVAELGHRSRWLQSQSVSPGLQHFAHFVKTQFPIRFIDVDLTKKKKKLRLSHTPKERNEL